MGSFWGTPNLRQNHRTRRGYTIPPGPFFFHGAGFTGSGVSSNTITGTSASDAAIIDSPSVETYV